ncbi:MAG: hypothetical protein IPJ15_13475 [Actinomycetales bacterium]|nr:hypothetical protein [Candidatus Phosphoribacter baldrii]
MSSPAGTPERGERGSVRSLSGVRCRAPPDAAFCEQCGHDFGAAVPTPATAGPTATRNGETQTRHAPVRAQTADEGLESPLDLGWTGPVSEVRRPRSTPRRLRPMCPVRHGRLPGRLLRHVRGQSNPTPRPLR